MPLLTSFGAGVRGLGWASHGEAGIVWTFSSHGGTATGVAGTSASEVNGKVLQPHDGYGISPVNTAWYWSNITTNTTASVISKGANYHAIGSGYFGGLMWQIGGSNDIYHNNAYKYVYSYNGSSWTARTNLPNESNRSSAAYDTINGTAGLFYFPGSKYPSTYGFPGDILNKFYKLTSTTGSWTAIANTPEYYRQGMYPCYTSGGYVTIINGWQNTTYNAYRYNVSSNSFSLLSTPPVTGIGYWMMAEGDKAWFIDYNGATAYSMKDSETTWSVGKAITGTVQYAGTASVGSTIYNLTTGTKTP